MPVTVRMPEDLHASITEVAKRDSRSFNAQIAVLLREALERRAEEQKSQPAPPAK